MRHWPVIVMAEEEPLRFTHPTQGYPVLMMNCAPHQVHISFFHTDILLSMQLAAVCSAFDGHPLVNNVFTVDVDFIWNESWLKARSALSSLSVSAEISKHSRRLTRGCWHCQKAKYFRQTLKQRRPRIRNVESKQSFKNHPIGPRRSHFLRHWYMSALGLSM